MAPDSPHADISEIAGAKAIYRRLLGYAKAYRWMAVVAVFGMLVEAAAAGVFTALMEPLVDETFIAKNKLAIAGLPLFIVALFVVRGMATFVTDYGMASIGRGVVLTLRRQIMHHYLRLPSAYFDQGSVAKAISRLTYQTEQVAQASSDAVKVVITDSLTLMFLLAVMVMQSFKITLTMLIMAPLIAWIISRVGGRYRKINHKIQASVAQLAHLSEQALQAEAVVKIYEAQQHEESRFTAVAEQNRKLQIKVESTKATSSAIVQVLAAIALAIIVFLAGQEAMQDRLKPGEFVSLMTAMMAMLPSLKRITNVQGMIQKGIAAADGIFHILDAPPEKDEGTVEIARTRGAIEFRNVGLRYASQANEALRDISFEIEPGMLVAVVGRSGSGKSSLVRLLPRLYEPTAGEIALDGIPLGNFSLKSLRRQVALVNQDIVLLDDTVAANIAYGSNSGQDAATLRKAAEAANALGFIEALPRGFATQLGENGVALSGGQRQRLAIARALLKDAPILILDEATSSLDSESEHLVQSALERIMRSRTSLVIAHRLSTVERADLILVLDEGRLVEQGAHRQLLAHGGTYAQLHKLQFVEAERARAHHGA